MRKLGLVGACFGLLLGLAVAGPVEAKGGLSKLREATQLCDSWYGYVESEVSGFAGDAYLVPMAYPDGEDVLPIISRWGCISTVLRGGNQVPVPYDALSYAAVNSQCQFLESVGAIPGYPYNFYGNPAYLAKSRLGCIYFLRQFHLGLLPPGPG
jgi:hypothetical protein